MWRHVASNALTFLVVILFLVAGVVLWSTEAYRAEGPLAEPICLQVERGSNMRRVSEDLAGQGAIASEVLFRLGADYAGKESALKAGSFLVPQGASMAEITDIVTRGGGSTCGTEVVYRVGIARTLAEVRELDPATGRFEEIAEFVPGEDAPPATYEEVKRQVGTQYRIALAEGVTSWQVVQALNALDVVEGSVEEVPPEGSLAPRSYAIAPGQEAAGLIEEMQAQQARILQEEWAARAEGLPFETPEEALIMASIVEKETGLAGERGQVASVFVNRLERGMRLQTDPTVIYGITQGQGVLGRGLRQSELRGETPWNTYVIDGMPPTPIANPGRESIRAALNPDETDYLYFVADGTGGHAFATSLEEHNRNVARWRQIEAERAAAGQ